MTPCTECGGLTSQPVTEAVFRGEVIVERGESLCRECLVKKLPERPDIKEKAHRPHGKPIPNYRLMTSTIINNPCKTKLQQ